MYLLGFEEIRALFLLKAKSRMIIRTFFTIRQDSIAGVPKLYHDPKSIFCQRNHEPVHISGR